MSMKKIAVATGIVSAALASTLVTAPTADAASRIISIGNNCYGANPNYVGFPFFGGANVTTNAPWPGQITINSDSKDVLPYTTYTTVRVTTLSNNHTQTFRRTWHHTMGDNSGYMISGIRATGRVKVTISAINVGMFQTQRGPTCSGIVRV
ncbi:hypothetical protein SAMN04488550_3289 [Gordonia malaquae]|uniref:Uncharacterized protein n=1 Tax=Gordonia malaquae NBRC 108250 TaxID=1223542 RepID=M3VCT8_GORML|nr:hypothetical protein [Gordonia malaquae]GAC77899.1 hypothetical protein GM1_001_00220 [Gordonia malaquae NBRC 108250]SED83913.1 hypothetical protein SAMN04488550_3289 [Gordonia malaquae]